jgi:hypothetical protein
LVGMILMPYFSSNFHDRGHDDGGAVGERDEADADFLLFGGVGTSGPGTAANAGGTMAIREAPKAAETKSRREKDGAVATSSAFRGQFLVFHCLLLDYMKIEKQNGRHTRTANGSADGRPCP